MLEPTDQTALAHAHSTSTSTSTTSDKSDTSAGHEARTGDVPDALAPPPAGQKPRHIGLLLFEGVEELDAVGPWEVLAFWTLHYPDDGWTISCLSADGRDVIGAKNLVLGAHHSFADVPDLEVLIHPGGHGTRRLMRDEAHLDWVRTQRNKVPIMTSVCTGCLVYAAAGLLTNRPATTHWQQLNLLSEVDPTVIPDVEARFVDDGDLITSAGVSAGIDMALHLVARLAGTDRAREVRRGIQYDPRPPV
jgi:transcriptional regulator GlxA family with amidase domain